MIDEAHSQDSGDPDWSNSELFIGSGDQRGGMVVVPSLRQQVAEELGRDAAILKERRKAAEARQEGKGGKPP